MNFKKILVLVVALLLVCNIVCAFAGAEEVEGTKPDTETVVPEEPPVEEEPPVDETPSVEEVESEVKQRLNVVLTWLEEQLPVIISTIAALFGIVVGVVSKIKENIAKVFFTKEKEKNAVLVTALDKQSVETLRAELIPIIQTSLAEEVEKLEITDAVYADMKAENKLILAALSSLIRGATNAWAQSPAAVAELTKTADDVAVHNLSLQVVALEKLLYAKYGADAKELIEKARAGEV
jgi:uncharacterized protein YnzC (UPF0291/DUF896 family)